MKAYVKNDPSKTLGTVLARYQTTEGQWRLTVKREGATLDADERDFEVVHIPKENVYTTAWQN
jgi:hypothetical protein